MKTMIGALYNNLSLAYFVVLKLRLCGLDISDLNLVLRDFRGQRETYAPIRFLDRGTLPEWADYAVILDILNGMLAGLTTVTVPNVGPLLATGPLASALQQTGTDSDSLAAVLTQQGLSSSDADEFAKGIRQGETLLIVRAAPTLLESAVEIMRAF